jgi:hypothetical protein
MTFLPIVGDNKHIFKIPDVEKKKLTIILSQAYEVKCSSPEFVFTLTTTQVRTMITCS